MATRSRETRRLAMVHDRWLLAVRLATVMFVIGSAGGVTAAEKRCTARKFIATGQYAEERTRCVLRMVTAGPKIGRAHV